LVAEVERFAVPGLAVAVTRGDDVLLSECMGVRDISSGLPVTPSTLFAIGSSTKTFTAALVGGLVEDGVLSWDEPVRNYLPSLRLQDTAATELLTLRDMLSHRSGLPRHDLVWYGNDALTRDEAVATLRHLQPSRSFREAWQYNNLLYLAAGHLCGQVLGMSWEDAVEKRLLGPLGMGSTNFSAAAAIDGPQTATPYMSPHDELEAVRVRDLGVCGPAGSMNSTLSDMTRWAMAHANGGVVDGRQVLSSATLHELHSPAMVRPVERTFPEVITAGYGLGWFLETYRGHPIAHHGGNIDGFSAMLAVLPELQVGVVALTNRHVSGLVNAVPYVVFDAVLGLEPANWGERLHTMLGQMAAGSQELRERAVSRPAGAPPSHPLEDFVGTYEHPAYGRLDVDVHEGRLRAGFHELDWVTTHRTHDIWEMRSDRMTTTVPLSFQTDPDGRVALATVPFEPAADPLVFRKMPGAAPDEQALAVLCGTYSLGPVQVTVRRVDGGLVAELGGGPAQRLVSRGGLTFAIDGTPNVTVEFSLGDTGAATELIAEPMGVFRRVDELAG
jgi:CubicO group peptidase (beta-lactamase class C family)